MSVMPNRRWVELEQEAAEMAYNELLRRLEEAFGKDAAPEILEAVIADRLAILGDDDDVDVELEADDESSRSCSYTHHAPT